jgi:hypothetical protein
MEIREEGYDELGEMREGYSPGVLLSHDFTKVDQHIWAAFSTGLSSHPELCKLSEYVEKNSETCQAEHSKQDNLTEMHLFCASQMKKCRDTTELGVKKFALLVCICKLEATQDFYRQRSPPEIFEPWLVKLKENLHKFFFGAHKWGDEKCKTLSDCRYPNLISFVADMTSIYVNL